MIGIDRESAITAVLIILIGCIAIAVIMYVNALKNDCGRLGGVLVKGALGYECLVIDGVKTWPK